MPEQSGNQIHRVRGSAAKSSEEFSPPIFTAEVSVIKTPDPVVETVVKEPVTRKRIGRSFPLIKPPEND